LVAARAPRPAGSITIEPVRKFNPNHRPSAIDVLAPSLTAGQHARTADDGKNSGAVYFAKWCTPMRHFPHGEAMLRWCVLGLIMVPALAWAIEPIRMATHVQPPYGTYQADGKFDGIAVRVLSCVLERMHRPLRIEVYPWERAQALAELGVVSGFFPATIKPERLKWAGATDVIADQKWVWFMPSASTLDPHAPAFKADARVGAHFGSNRLKMLEEERYHVVAKPQTDEVLLAMLELGRVDAILGGDLAIAEAMVKLNIPATKLRQVVERDMPLHAYFGQKFLAAEPGFLDKFNTHVDACRPPQAQVGKRAGGRN
jgi:polar amino acid transport system substrate-binding protein